MDLSQVFRRPRVRKGAVVFGLVALLLGLLGLLAPHYLKPYLEQTLSEQLHRPATIRELSINPYALSVTVRDLVLRERNASAEFIRLGELHVNLEAQSLLSGAPVISELRLDGLHAHLVRQEDRRYNLTDLVEEFLNKPDTDPPTRFAIHNIRVTGGRIDFDDRPAGKQHVVSEINLGVPFLSNLPSRVDSYIQPSLAAKVNGAPIAIQGKALPFSQTRQATVSFKLQDVDLPGYFDYIPVQLGFSVPAAKLDADLTVTFSQPADKPAALNLSGTAALRNAAAVARDGKPLVKFDALQVALKDLDVTAGKLTLDKVELAGPEVDLRRLRNGHLNLEALAALPSKGNPGKPAPSSKAGKAGQGYRFTVAELKIADGRLALTDEVPAKPFHANVERLNLDLRKVGNQGGAPGSMQLSLHTSSGEELKLAGTVGLAPMAVQGEVQLAGLRPANYAAYYQPFLDMLVEEGRLDAGGKFSFSLEGDKLQATGNALALAVKDLRLRQPGEKQPFFTLPSLTLSGAQFDLARRSIVLSELKTSDGRLVAAREQDGRFNLEKMLVAAPGAKAQPGGRGEAPWTVTLDRLAVENYGVRLEDRASRRGIPLVLEPLALTGEKLSNAKGGRANVSLKTGINRKGRAALAGTLDLAALQAALKVDVTELDLVPLQPYFSDRLNVLVTRGALTTRGDLDLALGEPVKAGFRGNLGVSNLALIDRGNSEDLLKWKSLQIAGVRAAVDKGPVQLQVAEVALSDFYAHLVVNKDGTLALRKLVRETEPASDAARGAKLPGPGTGEAISVTAPQSVAQSAGAPANRIRIDKVRFKGGAVNFSDYFIRPNYSANLTDIDGAVTGLSSESGTTAGVELKGRMDGYAPVQLVGKVNPLAKEVYLDLRAEAKGVELTGLTPYSERYAGYAIDKGKLSLDIRYFIENRQLRAENHLFLDQLTFGERVESPEATKLPVLLAVALLKNSRGEIDVNLPVGGSLDDPEFSVGGIVFRVVVNLLTKAITSPFALLGSIGGGGEELGYLEYAPGSADIAKPAEDKLARLASALKDRPGLKLEIAGRADPESDLEGLKRLALEHKVKAQKLRETVRQGKDAGSLDEVQISPQEWPIYLEAAYKREKIDKPRNLIGLAKSLPTAEMEKLMLANISVTQDELRALGDRRAKAVRDWLQKTGGVADERLFVIGSHLGHEDSKPLEGKSPALARVDFSLR